MAEAAIGIHEKILEAGIPIKRELIRYAHSAKERRYDVLREQNVKSYEDIDGAMNVTFNAFNQMKDELNDTKQLLEVLLTIGKGKNTGCLRLYPGKKKFDTGLGKIPREYANVFKILRKEGWKETELF